MNLIAIVLGLWLGFGLFVLATKAWGRIADWRARRRWERERPQREATAARVRAQFEQFVDTTGAKVATEQRAAEAELLA